MLPVSWFLPIPLGVFGALPNLYSWVFVTVPISQSLSKIPEALGLVAQSATTSELVCAELSSDNFAANAHFESGRLVH